MKCISYLVLLFTFILKFCFIICDFTNNEKLIEKLDDLLVDNIKKKINKNNSDDDIADSIKNLLRDSNLNTINKIKM